MPTYATAGDLMLGDMALGTAVSPDKYIQEAEEDVDIAIGEVYEMPYDVASPDAVERTVILLRRITARLASGRLILAQAIGGEDQSLQAYGRHLIEEAEAVMNAIIDGRLEFEGPEPIVGATEYTGPTVYNHDKASAVDSFYEAFLPHRGTSPPGGTGPVWAPGGGG